VPILVLRAYEPYAPLTVVQVDAHLDFRDEVEGVREGYSSAMRRAAEMGWVDRIVQVGLRGVGSARADDVADAIAHGNALVTARELDDLGPEAAVDHVPDGASIFLSLDCDGLDPTVLPAVRAPMPGGLSYRQAAELVRRLPERGRIAGMTVTELVPSMDVTGLSTLVAVRLIVQLIGAMLRSGQIG
jgi:agmatinase